MSLKTVIKEEKNILCEINWGFNIADIIELKSGYEARVALPCSITMTDVDLFIMGDRKRARLDRERRYLTARFIFQKISGQYLILKETELRGEFTTDKTPIEILEASKKEELKKRCLDLLIEESYKKPWQD